MFESLRSLAHEAKSTTMWPAEKVPGQNIQAKTAQYAAAKIELTRKLATMTTSAQQLTDLRLLRNIIKQHGINRSLLKFAYNKKGGMGFLIPGAPANEAMLDEVSMKATDPRAMQVVDGIDTVLDDQPKMVSDWIRDAASSMSSMMTNCASQMDWMSAGISDYTDALDDLDYDAEAVANSSCCAMSCNQATACVDAMLTALPDLDATIPDPTDRDAMDEHKQMLSDRVDLLGPHTGLSLSVDNPHLIELAMPVDTKYPMMTMDELGYDMDSTSVLMAKIEELIAAMNDLLERKDMIIAQMHTAADMVDAMDNDVPPALDDMSAATEDDGNGDMMTQADVMHCHMSSHMCCMSAVMDTAMSMMQNAMTVCHHVCTTCGEPADAS